MNTFIHTVSEETNHCGNAETVSRAVIKPFIHDVVKPFIHVDENPQSADLTPQEAPIPVPQMSVAPISAALTAPVPVAQMSAPVPDLSASAAMVPKVQMQYDEAKGILATLKANAAERLPAEPTGERQQLQAPRGKHYYRS